MQSTTKKWAHILQILLRDLMDQSTTGRPCYLCRDHLLAKGKLQSKSLAAGIMRRISDLVKE